MATKKPAKNSKNDATAKQKDGDDEVLFEGELTWTHERVAASPELMKRTPRGEQAEKAARQPLPSEGSIKIQEEGGGEIFSNEPLQIDHDETTDEPVDQSTYKQADASSDVAIADVKAPASSSSTQASGMHGRTLQPRDGFSKASVDPFAADLGHAGTVDKGPAGTAAGARAGANGPVAGQFADSDAAPPAKPWGKIIGFSLGFLLLLAVAAAAAYMLKVVPNKPDNILKQALANSLQQQSVNFVYDAQQTDTAGKQQMHFVANGGVSQAGSLDMTATLANTSTAAPLAIAVRSIDGSESFVQFANLAANQAYLAKLGMPAGGPLAAQEGKWLNVTADVRASIFKSLGLGTTAGWSLSSADQRALADIYARNQFLRVAQTLPDETVGGQQSTRYSLAVDKTQLTAFMIAAKSGTKSLGITQTQIDAANKLDTSALRLDVWVNKQAKLVTQVQFSKRNAAGVYAAKLTLPKYNETLALQQPTAANDILGSLKPFAGPTDVEAQALLNKILSNYSLAK